MIRCIIPFYNEAGRVETVVRTALATAEIDEVVAIDDGSADGGSDSLTGIADPRFRLIQHDENRGKAAIMREGFMLSGADIVIFLDADLRGLTADHIRSLIRPLSGGSVRLTYSGREKISFLNVLSGDRALFTADWNGFFRNTAGQGYAVEMLMNRHALKTGLPVLQVRWPDVSQTYKSAKRGGLLAGVRAELGAISNIMRSTGVTGFFWTHGMFWFRTRAARDYRQVLSGSEDTMSGTQAA
ncbi:MAG: Poly-beta-1,6-N-acetyl-D-glucosamine synthase [candidate division WS6 bacterium OLB20]|uniref:Poly-beta-1,6-N-acetyl-D-glucosamine synthase n=1 Tax=candidate division WS6 bacterium OLB20 TaxID=1617426 RepID=A0A136LZ77_9BACT|nr:MAG: Poly-beta-1,6-N-acetyl-D-glucosamine synthase [candidate division WS6 bacterium OLB20]